MSLYRNTFNPPVTAEVFKEVYRKCAVKLLDPKDKPYLFLSLLALYKYWLADHHQQKDRITCTVSEPDTKKVSWVVIKFRKSKSAYRIRYRVNYEGVYRSDVLQKLKNVFGLLGGAAGGTLIVGSHLVLVPCMATLVLSAIIGSVIGVAASIDIEKENNFKRLIVLGKFTITNNFYLLIDLIDIASDESRLYHVINNEIQYKHLARSIFVMFRSKNDEEIGFDDYVAGCIIIRKLMYDQAFTRENFWRVPQDRGISYGEFCEYIRNDLIKTN
jgi:hypothetical protein